MITAGSGQGLGLLARYFNKGNIVTATPTFGILPSTAKAMGTEVIEIPLTDARVHNLEAMLSAINDKTSLVYICNPANPSSTIVKSAALQHFCEEASRKAVVLIDEAYIDFVDAPDNISMTSLVDKNPNILVIRTFSKIHAMAGLRIGFTIGHPSLIKKLEENNFQSSSFCLSVLSMSAALASLKDPQHLQLCKEKNAAARQFTFDELKKMGHSPIPSYTNFIYCPIKNYKGDLADDMLKKNIILRYNTEEKWYRVSIGTMDEMKIFVTTMKAI